MNLLDNIKAVLDEQPKLSLTELDPKSTLVFSVDMNNGFIREGALSSPRVAAILPQTCAFLKACREKGFKVVGVTDTHDESSIELSAYPAHCLRETAEPLSVEEIRPYLEEVYPKNSTNAFFAPGIRPLIEGAKTIVITGCCTDICISQFALTAKAWANQANRPLSVIVVKNLTQTYDGPGHNGDLMHLTALSSLMGNGVSVREW